MLKPVVVPPPEYQARYTTPLPPHCVKLVGAGAAAAADVALMTETPNTAAVSATSTVSARWATRRTGWRFMFPQQVGWQGATAHCLARRRSSEHIRSDCTPGGPL